MKKSIIEIEEMVKELMSKVSEDENYSLTWHDLCDIQYALKAHQELEQPISN